VCVCVCVCVCVFVFVCACVRVCACVCVLHMYTHTHTHTYIHMYLYMLQVENNISRALCNEKKRRTAKRAVYTVEKSRVIHQTRPLTLQKNLMALASLQLRETRNQRRSLARSRSVRASHSLPLPMRMCAACEFQ